MPIRSIEVSGGTFRIEFELDHPAPEEDDTATVHGAKFRVDFIPKVTGDYGVIQLINAIVDVAEYAHNKTSSGWAVDKQADPGRSASNAARALLFGMTADGPRANPMAGLGGGPTQAAWVKDTPREMVPNSGGSLAETTKFAQFAFNLSKYELLEEGVIWGYNTQGILQEPKITPLTKEHRAAMRKYLGRIGKENEGGAKCFI